MRIEKVVLQDIPILVAKTASLGDRLRLEKSFKGVSGDRLLSRKDKVRRRFSL